ncbi:hypothetical protein HAHE_34650 [Haloferula helveola]|uniref:Uncharacterized protein n=1 Tax=Haloferula helveola TaxID=490095 RepID=A0ABM7RCV0_9BACT|nr:hypothetical protein HAHE_34650 [Haloferula helveola]
MKLVIPASASLTLVAAFLASCTPYPEQPPVPGPDVAQNNPAGTPGDPNQPDKPDEGTTSESMDKPDETPKITENVTDPEPPKPAPKPNNQVARPVPGKPGFVFSPYNNKIIDVKGIPSGTLVADPTYPAAEKKYFRVP